MLEEYIENIIIEENVLKILFNTPKREYSIYLNKERVFNDEITGRFMFKYSLRHVFTDTLLLKVESDNEIYTKNIKRSISSYSYGLKKTLQGKDNQFFLVNDKNNEIRQHFDKNYHSNLDIESFKESIKSKKEYLNSMGVTYNFFVIPDKSITLRDYLPFETSYVYRHVDKLREYVSDLSDVITVDDTLSNDTHVSSAASIKILSRILSEVYEKDADYFMNELLDRTTFYEKFHEGDLFAYKNWSYERDAYYKENLHVKTLGVKVLNEYESVDLENVPQVFRQVSNRKSQYYKNENALVDKKVLVLHDSSCLEMVNAFIASYREVFFYWDHWYFNKDLVDYLNPDSVIEIRTERFLDNPLYPVIDDNYRVKYPVNLSLENYGINEGVLSFRLNVFNYCMTCEEADVKILINDKIVYEDHVNCPLDFSYSLNDYGDYTLSVKVVDSYGDVHNVNEKFCYYEPLSTRFNDLKMTYKGVDDTFFRVNDRNNEILQHYDKMYTPRLDRNKFIESSFSKKKYLESLNINYAIFAIPDKSIVLSKYLDFGVPTRIITKLECVNDLLDYVDEDDFLVNDTNLKEKSCIKLVATILNQLYPKHNVDEYCACLCDSVSVVESMHNGNLFTRKAWSYDSSLREKFYSVECEEVLVDNVFRVDNKSIPLEYRKFSGIESQYYKNSSAFLDKKVIILHDSAINPFIPALTASFKECFFYFDQWYFNKNLLEYIDVDVVIEIREESSFENPLYPLVSEIDEVLIPTNTHIEILEITEDNLKFELKVDDLRNIPVTTDCELYIDRTKLSDYKLENGKDIINLDISTVGSGEHKLKVLIESNDIIKSKIIEEKFFKAL